MAAAHRNATRGGVMRVLLLCLLLSLTFPLVWQVSSQVFSPQHPVELRVLSFNIWMSGGYSLSHTIEAILAASADIVGLQECNLEAAKAIAAATGYNYVTDTKNNAILSPYPIAKIAEPQNGLGATVTYQGPDFDLIIHVFNVHLYYLYYGPYYVQQGVPHHDIFRTEAASRLAEIEDTLNLLEEIGTMYPQSPLILMGDFNSPSHLDYTDMMWPTSVACESRGFADSYRELHPGNRRRSAGDPQTKFDWLEPGITWTRVPELEPFSAFDRIDFIYYAKDSNRCTVPLYSSEVDEKRIGWTLSNSTRWPSDHRAVFSLFDVSDCHLDVQSFYG